MFTVDMGLPILEMKNIPATITDGGLTLSENSHVIKHPIDL